MESKLKVGDYVRTKDGIIAKCVEEKASKYVFDKIVIEDGYYNNYIFKDIPKSSNFIIKSSPNIIDLIEVGDYVNGMKVIKHRNILMMADTFDLVEDEDIKSIVTKEQFKEMEYKI